jgi:hypothetical protein
MTDGTPISERVNALVPANMVALSMSLYTPTFYRYMTYYDEGIRKEIPDIVLGFLDLVDRGCTKDEAIQYLEGRKAAKAPAQKKQEAPAEGSTDAIAALEKRIENIRGNIVYSDQEIAKNAARRKELDAEIARLEGGDDPNLSMKMDVLKREIEVVESQVSKVREMRARSQADLDRFVSEYETMTGGSMGKRWTSGDVRTLCLGYFGKCMVIFDTPMGAPEEVRMEITIDTPYGRMPVATFVPEKGRNYITVDDMVPGAGIGYEVVVTYSTETLRSGRYELQFE